MAEQNVQEQISSLKAHLNGLIEKSTADLENKVSDKVDGQIKAEIKATMDSLKELQKPMEARLDSFEAEIQKNFNERKQAVKSFSELLAEELGKEDIRKSLTDRSGVSIDFAKLTGKAVGPMTPAASLTGEVVPADYRPGIVELVQRATHVRDLLSQGTTSSSVFRYVEETAGEGGAENTAPGAQKGQIDYDLEAKDAPVRKITGFVRIADELLDDITGLNSFLSSRLTKDIRTREDAQLLYGAGSGQNLTGLDQNAATFAATAADANATIIDLLISVLSQLESANYTPNGILLSPSDYYRVFLAKSSDGDYLMQQLVQRVNGQLFIAGIPVFRSTAVVAGEYFVGDWVNGAQIMDREGLSVRFYEQDDDNRQKNLVTVVAEERLAFPIYYPESYVYGTIATDIAKIKNFT